MKTTFCLFSYYIDVILISPKCHPSPPLALRPWPNRDAPKMANHLDQAPPPSPFGIFFYISLFCTLSLKHRLSCTDLYLCRLPLNHKIIITGATQLIFCFRVCSLPPARPGIRWGYRRWGRPGRRGGQPTPAWDTASRPSSPVVPYTHVSSQIETTAMVLEIIE